MEWVGEKMEMPMSLYPTRSSENPNKSAGAVAAQRPRFTISLSDICLYLVMNKFG